MAIKRPDIYEHNNPNLAIVDSDFVRGGSRVVANLTELYALANKIDQLKERVTKVYVISEDITYVLVNKLDITEGIFNSTAWEESGGMSTVYADGITITGDGSEENPLVAQIPEETDPVFNASQAKNITSTHITVLNNTSGINTGDQDLSELVPYTGATKNVDLGDFNLKANGLEVDIVTPLVIERPGQIGWNAIDGTLNFGLLNGTTLQVGQELHFFGKASGLITNGDVVQFAGVQGDHFLIKKAVPSEINLHPEYLLGVATNTIIDNEFGYVTCFGKINEISTSTWTLVQPILYFDFNNGGMTQVVPSAPTRRITIASVIKLSTGEASNGIIFVRPSWGFKITDLDDVNGTPLTTSGQIMIWNNDLGVFDFTGNINDFMKESDYVGETGTKQVNYAKSADEAEQAIHAYSAQQDALGREIHTTYALKDSGITPPETETITLTNASPVYTVTNATAPALIVLNNATTDGEIYLSGELDADKSITIQIFGNDTLISSHSGSNTYQDEDTIFASFEIATASWFVTDTETTIIPDYSDMVVDTMLVDPTITPKPGYIYIAGTVFTINTLVFIKSTSTPTQTGIYKVFSTITGGSNMYLIAAGTALHTVRVKDGEVWYSQYDGKNTSTLIFEKFSNKINKTNDTVNSLALDNVCLVKVEGNWKEISYQNIRNDFYIESDTAPLNPKNGMGWVDITSGIKYNYTLGAWVELSAGANGKGQYEIALDNGFIGTEAEWLDFISYGSKELMITKVGLNGDLYPVKYPVDKQRTITGYKLASNATDFSVMYEGLPYTKTNIVGLVLLADTELTIIDLLIAAGNDTGTAILYLQ